MRRRTSAPPVRDGGFPARGYGRAAGVAARLRDPPPFGLGPLVLAAVVLPALAACRCDGNGGPADDAADDAPLDVMDDAVADVAAEDATDAAEDGPVCSPDAIRWPYPPTWEREEWEEWEFEPIRWDVSAYREQPVPGCERLDIGPPLGDRRWAPHRSSNYVDDTRAAMGAFANVCTPMGDGRALGLYVVDTTDWTLSLVHVSGTEHDGFPSGGEASFSAVALVDSGLTLISLWKHSEDVRVTKQHLEYDATAHRMRVVLIHDGVGQGLYGSGSHLLDLRNYTTLHLYDIDRLRWTQMAVTASRGDAGLPGVWRVDFADGRAVWDMWSGRGIMSATADAPDDTVLIGYTGSPQWSPTISGDVVCWNDGRDGAYPPGHGTDTGDPHVWCADLRTEESWCASCDLPADEVLRKDGEAEVLPIVAGGPWVAFPTRNRSLTDPYVPRDRLYHRGLNRSMRLAPFGGNHSVGVKYLDEDTVVFYFDGNDVAPLGMYRCDLRALFPEAFATDPEDDPPDGGPSEP